MQLSLTINSWVTADIVPWAFLLLIDTVIFAMTLHKTISISRDSRYRIGRLIMRDGKPPDNISYVIIDILSGTMYFG